LPATPTRLFFSGRDSSEETLLPFLRGLVKRWRIRVPLQSKTATPTNRIKRRIQRLVVMSLNPGIMEWWNAGIMGKAKI
jgi:hypothetical protein